MNVAVQPSAPVFGSNILRDSDLPFRAWSGLTLELDGQPEDSPVLLGLAGYLVRQALADLYPEKVKRAADIELLLFGLKAKVCLESGPVVTLGSGATPPELSETRVLPGLTIGNLLMDASEEGGDSIAELYGRLAPADGIQAALAHLRDAGLERPTQAISALMPSMTIELQPPYDEKRTLVYESKAVALKAQLQQAPDILDRLGMERVEILLGEEPLGDDEPVREVAEYLLEKMLRELQRRALQAGVAGLESRAGEWDRLRLVVGSEVRCEPLFAFDPSSLQPVFPHATRAVRFAGMDSLLLPEHDGVEVAQRLWSALADDDAREQWRKVEGSDSFEGRCSLIRLTVQARLDVLKLRGDEAPLVLESHTDAELFPEPPAEAEPAPEPVEQIAAAEPEAEVIEPESFELHLTLNGKPWTEGGELEAFCRRLALRCAASAKVELQPGHLCQLDLRSGDVKGLPVPSTSGEDEVQRSILLGDQQFSLESGPEREGARALYEQLGVDEEKGLAEFASVDNGRSVPLILALPEVKCRVLQDKALLADVTFATTLRQDSTLASTAWQGEAAASHSSMDKGFLWLFVAVITVALLALMN